MNQTWFLPVRSTCLCATSEQSPPPLIFQHSFYLNANTTQWDFFCQEVSQREILAKMEKKRSEGKRGRQKRGVRKSLCFSDFNLSGVIVSLVEEIRSLCCPAGHQGKTECPNYWTLDGNIWTSPIKSSLSLWLKSSQMENLFYLS